MTEAKPGDRSEFRWIWRRPPGAQSMDVRRQRLAPSSIALVFLLFAMVFMAPSVPAAAQTPNLVLWLTPMDAEYFPRPASTDEEKDRFLRSLREFFQVEYQQRVSDRIRVDPALRRKLRHDSAFARQVLGQRRIFAALSQFLSDAGNNYSGTITVRFFDWEELLGILERQPQDANAQADLLIAPSSWIAHLAALGVLAEHPLDTRVYHERAGLPSCVRSLGVFSPIARAFGRNWGACTTYTVPWFVDLRLYFYWKDRFPNADFRDVVHFEKALQDAQRAANHGGPAFAMPAAADWDLLHYFSLILWGQGDDWMTGWRTFVARDAARYVADRMLEWSTRELVGFPRVVRSDLEDRFLARDVGSLIAGPWLIYRLRQQLGPQWETQVGVALPPFNTGPTPTTFMGGLHLGLTPRGAASPHAERLLRHLTTDATVPWGTEALTIPGSLAGYRAFLDGLPETSALRELVPNGVATAKYYPAIPRWARAVEAFATRIDLLQLFKHLSEGTSTGSLHLEIDALVDRINEDVYRAPQQQIYYVLGIVVVSLAVVGRLTRRSRRLEEERDKARKTVRDKEQRLREMESDAERLRQEVTTAREERESARARGISATQQCDIERFARDIATLDRKIVDLSHDLEKEREQRERVQRDFEAAKSTLTMLEHEPIISVRRVDRILEHTPVGETRAECLARAISGLSATQPICKGVNRTEPLIAPLLPMLETVVRPEPNRRSALTDDEITSDDPRRAHAAR